MSDYRTQKSIKEAAEKVANEGRELVLIVLSETDDYLTPAQIGAAIGVNGYTAGQWLRTLVEHNKVKRIGGGPGRYMYSKLSDATVVPRTELSAVPVNKAAIIKEKVTSLSDRWLIAWMINGRGYGEVLTSETDARTKARKLSGEMPGVTIFIGKATRKAGNVITETELP